MTTVSLNQLTIGIKGAGEMASAVAWRLFCANIQKIFMMEVEHPRAVRRAVSFCEVVYESSQKVEDVEAVKVSNPEGIQEAWENHKIAVIVDPQWRLLQKLRPDVTVDAIVAKKNLGTNLAEAPLVVGLGPGFSAGKDVHMVIETNRGHNLGRIITSGSAEPNTGNRRSGEIRGSYWISRKSGNFGGNRRHPARPYPVRHQRHYRTETWRYRSQGKKGVLLYNFR
jgi:xanthine dehydrogenase accessory factor